MCSKSTTRESTKYFHRFVFVVILLLKTKVIYTFSDAYPENLDYNSGYNHPSSGYEQPGSFDSYPDPALTLADPSLAAYGDAAYDYNSFGHQIDPQMALGMDT